MEAARKRYQHAPLTLTAERVADESVLILRTRGMLPSVRGL